MNCKELDVKNDSENQNDLSSIQLTNKANLLDTLNSEIGLI